MRWDESLLGTRVTVRQRLPGVAGPSGGTATTDVVGRIVALEPETATVERRDGELVTVHEHDVVALRRVPDRPRRSRPAMDFSVAELTSIATRGWPPLECLRLGDWLLRAAGGFTSRANSAAVQGDPGLPLPEAFDRVVDFYTDRGLAPRAQVGVDTAAEAECETAGWQEIDNGHSSALVQTVDLPTDAYAADTAEIEIADTTSDAWLSMYNRTNGIDTETARAVLEGPPTVRFLRIGDPPIAIGRVVVTGEWAGLSCIEVTESQRRRGYANAIVAAALNWAIDHGANKAYAQTEPDNAASLSLFAGYGFGEHHRYRYLRPPR